MSAGHRHHDQDLATRRAALAFPMAPPSDFFALLKPRVMSLVVFTALVGMMLAPHMNPVIGFASLLAIAVGRGRVRLPQHVVRRRYRRDDGPHRSPADPVRPDHAGRGARFRPDAFSRLGRLPRHRVELVAAAMLAFTIFFYAVVYSMWLKRWTSQNIVIGGAAGAFPPMIGYAAATGSVNVETFVLFVDHLPVDAAAFLGAGDAEVRAITAAPACRCCLSWRASARRGCRSCSTRWFSRRSPCCPPLMGFAGPLYGVVAARRRRRGCCALASARHRARQAMSRKACQQLFGFSILYLFLLFARAAVRAGRRADRLLGGLGRGAMSAERHEPTTRKITGA